MHAMILAAGYGTRLRPLTDKLAKPAIPFLDIPLIAYPLYYLEHIPLTKLVVNTHHLPDTVTDALNKLTEHKSYPIQFIHEINILGSGGGVKNAESALKGHGDFLVCNADALLLFNHERNLAPFIEFHKKNKNLVTHLTCDHEGLGTQFGAVWTDENHKVVGYGKKKLGENLRPEHNTGYYLYSERIFEYLPDGPSNVLLDGIQKAIDKGERVYTYYDPDILWYETGTLNDYNQAQSECKGLLNQDSPKAKNLRKILNYFTNS